MTDVGNDGGFADWQDWARELLRQRIAPGAVCWDARVPCVTATVAGDGESPGSVSRSLYMPRRFVDLAKVLLLDEQPRRFALAYRLLWRLQTEHALLDRAEDQDVAQAAEMTLIQTLVTGWRGASYSYRRQA